MNQKEIAELRRRWAPGKNAVSQLYGCLVNPEKQIVMDLDESLNLLPQEETEQYLSLLKKTLSGKPGKNLIDIVFTTQQVMDSEEHRLLMALRSDLGNREIRQRFYETVAAALDAGENGYLLLLAGEKYDVPRRRSDGTTDLDGSDQVFSYFLCTVCPLKQSKTALGYFPGDNEFHCTGTRVIAAPELGFLFPAFDNRASNIYNSLFYTRKPEDLHQDFVSALFHTEPPMSAPEQRAVFETALTAALGEECTMERVQSVLDQLNTRIEAHKESRDPEPLVLTQQELTSILVDCGVSQAGVQHFRDSCEAQYGAGAVLDPANLVGSSRCQLKTEQAAINAPLDAGYPMETRVIDGRRYILVPAEGELALNGIPVL